MTTQPNAKPKAATFDIATRSSCDAHRETPSIGICRACLHAAPGRTAVKGYTCGEFGAHKNKGKGVYFYTFTHLATGLSCSSKYAAETKAAALVELARLAAEGLPDYARNAIAGKGWGGQ